LNTGELIRNEVIPVVGDLNKPETYQEVTKSAFVIDTVYDLARLGQPDGHAPNKVLLEVVAKAGEAQGVRKTYIFTSGVLVCSDGQEWRDENTLPTSPPPFKERIDFEAVVRNHPGVRYGFVIGFALPTEADNRTEGQGNYTSP